jgi:exopolysaccharide biosynthesis WecB/TagA/CpsF family protein
MMDIAEVNAVHPEVAVSPVPVVVPPVQCVTWPRKVPVFGVNVSITDYDEAAEAIVAAARAKQSAIVSCHAVHALITASDDPMLRRQVNTFDMITPDGQPVRWALNWLHGARLTERVYGPELTLRVCALAAQDGTPIYLYGGTDQVLGLLRANLTEKFPGLRIVGAESPPFRPLTPQEDREVVRRVRDSGARLVFIGLGAPKQDVFAYEHRSEFEAVQLCVGAAFDFHAGVKPMAPMWMQRHGLEWLYRLTQEPKRLWRRYMVTNATFLAKLARAMIGRPGSNGKDGAP